MIQLSPDKRALEIVEEGLIVYDIPLFAVNGMADLYRWRFHLRGKPWATPELLAEFERLAMESWRAPFYENQGGSK